MKTRIAINGFGRIGRTAFQAAVESEKLVVVAINDLSSPETLAYLLKYDSVYGEYKESVEAKKDKIVIAGKEFPCFKQPKPEALPWEKLKIDIVLECTGVFTDRAGSEKHLKAGARYVIISAPSKSEDIPTYLLGVNHTDFDPQKDKIVSNASCTTNAIAPVAKILQENLGIEKSLITTVHSYTSSQALVDGPSPKDLRRGRAAALNIVPTTTGAALCAAKTVPGLKGRFDGMALRVPSPCVSLVDLVALVKKKTSAQEVNSLFKKAASGELKGILDVSSEPLVSRDYVKNTYSGVVDLSLTRVIQDDLVKVFIWYDNEWGYSVRLVEITEYLGERLKN